MNRNYIALVSLSAFGIAALLPLPASSQTPPEAVVTANASSVFSSSTVAQADFDIVDTAMIEGSFDTFLHLFQELGMQEDLRGYGRFTVFAPVDEAFEALSEETMTTLLSDRDLLAKVLSYHVIASGTPLYSDDITSTTTQRTLERSEIEIRPRGRSIFVNSVRVIEEDIEAINGVIHAIDEVLLPPDVIDRLP